MKTIQTSAGQIELQEIIRALSQLKVPDLEGVTHKLLNILEKKKSPGLPDREEELVGRIKHGGPSASVFSKRDELLSKSFKGTLTESENKELLEVAEELDNWALERTCLMAELAEIWGTSLEEVPARLKIKPRPISYA